MVTARKPAVSTSALGEANDLRRGQRRGERHGRARSATQALTSAEMITVSERG
ncbi:hypothetical protein [Prauserella flavalba]|uniref:hypothetical protein n=1 Tax=Prauserella flavalba TaxID=1477506 RepID=UPI00143DDC80|nr:hypothetical protein [Prauserella flavalba]